MKLINFRKTSIYKKFRYKITKFKRKQLIRIKHSTNWIIYINVIKTWINDYIFVKHHLKVQFYINVFINNSIFYFFNSIKHKNENFPSFFNFIFYNWTKKSYSYFYSISHTKSFNNFFKNSNISKNWYLEDQSINTANIPYHNEWENVSYSLENNFQNFDFLIFFKITYFFFLKKLIETKKIMILIVYLSIFKI